MPTCWRCEGVRLVEIRRPSELSTNPTFSKAITSVLHLVELDSSWPELHRPSRRSSLRCGSWLGESGQGCRTKAPDHGPSVPGVPPRRAARARRTAVRHPALGRRRRLRLLPVRQGRPRAAGGRYVAGIAVDLQRRADREQGSGTCRQAHTCLSLTAGKPVAAWPGPLTAWRRARGLF